MGVTIESLELEIRSESKSAESGIKALKGTLDDLRQAVKGGAGLSSVSRALSKLNGTLASLNVDRLTRLKEIMGSLEGVKALQGVKLSSTIAKSISNIGRAASNINTDGISALRSLTSVLTSISNLRDVKISSSIARGITSIATAGGSIPPSALSNIRMLASAMRPLTRIGKVQISPSIGRQLTAIAASARSMEGQDFSAFGRLASALTPLSSVGKANLGSTINQLNKLPEVAAALEAVNLESFAQKIDRVASALRPLADQMNAVSRGFANFPSRINKAASSTDAIASKNRKAAMSYTDLFSLTHMAANAVRTIGGKIARSMADMNSYIENINLFNASMGQYASEAYNYADKVAQVMGIDPGEWMRNQGIFMTLADGFGVASDRAYIMSQQLTQLGYDLSSFFNISVEDGMQKLQSGLSGELEPLRRLGYDLSQARLEAVALSLGIDQSFNSMTQAEKAQLRYYAIMTQVTTAQGDMARTLNAPANQLRILQAQVAQASRAFGSIFIPVLNAVLPAVIAVAKAIRLLAAMIASLFGFSLPEIDYSGIGKISSGVGEITDGVGGMGDAMDKAGGSAKKLKSYLMGFDELNVIDPSSGGGGGGGGGGAGGGGGGGDWDWELPEYDFIGDAIASRVDEMFKKLKPTLDWMKEHLGEILAIGSAIGAEFLMWKIARTLIPELDMMRDHLKKMLSAITAVATALVTVVLVYNFDNEYMKTGKFGYLIADGIATALGSAITGAVIGGQFGAEKGLYAASATVALSALTSITAIYKGVSADGFSGNAVWLGLTAAIKGAMAAGTLAKALGLSFIKGAAIGFILTAAVTTVVTLIGVKMSASQPDPATQWGDVALTADEMKAVAKDLFEFDVTSTITIANTTIANEEEAKQALNAATAEFATGIRLITLGVTVDDSDGNISKLKAQLLGDAGDGSGGIVGAIKQTLETEKLTLSLSIGLSTSSDPSGESAGLYQVFGDSTALIEQGVSDLTNRLGALFDKGIKEGLSIDEAEIIAQLSESLVKINQALAQGDVIAKFEMNTENVFTDLTRESFSGALSEYKTYCDELEQGYRDVFEQVEADMRGNKAALDILYEQAAADRDRAMAEGNTELAAYYADLATQYGNQALLLEEKIKSYNVDDMVARAMAEATEEGKAKVREALDVIFGGALTGFDPSISLDWTSWIHLNSTDGVTQTVEEVAQGFAVTLEEVLHAQLGSEDYQVLIQAADVMGVTGFDLLQVDVQTQMVEAMAQAFGGETTIAALQSLGCDVSKVLASGISSGSTEIVSATQDTVTLMSDTLGEVTVAMTPELLAVFSSLGIDMTQWLGDGITEGTEQVEESMQNLGAKTGEAGAQAFEEATPGAVGAAKSSASDTGNAYLTELETGLIDGKSGVTAAAEEAGSGVNTTIKNTIDDAEETMTDGVNSACANITSNVTTVTTDSVAAVESMSENMDATIAESTSSAAASFEALCVNIVSDMENAYSNVIETWRGLPAWFTAGVKVPVSSTMALLGTEIVTKMGLARSSVQLTWAAFATWFTMSVFAPISASAGRLQAEMVSHFRAASENSKMAWGAVPTWFKSNVLSPMIQSVSNAGWYEAGRNAAKALRDGLKSVDMPQFRMKWATSSQTVNGQSVSVPVPKLDFYRSGGFPTRGQLFVAREAGAEMVGSIGRRTAVANNDQIVEGIYAGVVAAMRDSGGDDKQPLEVNVYLDGRQISATVEKHQRMRGRNVYPGGLLSNV